MEKIQTKASYQPQRCFSGDAAEVAFPLGGIGTGNISLGARGQLRDWEIFNRPAKGQSFPYTFFAIRTKEAEKAPEVRILEGRLTPPFAKSHGFVAWEMAGVPRFAESSLRGEYPLCYLDLRDDRSPVSVCLEAFTPMIPLDADNSGIPCAILAYSVTNTTQSAVEFTLAGTLPNTACHPAEDPTIWHNYNHPNMKTTRGTLYEEPGFAALHFTNDNGDKMALSYSDSTLSVLGSGTVAALPQWPDTGWWDAGQLFWDSLRDHGNFDGISQEMSCSETVKSGSLGLCDTLAPGETKTVTFLISWNVPNRINGWTEPEPCCCGGCCETPKQTKNYYAVKFADSLATARYVQKNFTMLCEATHRFHDGLFSSTIPDYVLDAVSANMTVLRSTTCFRLENGKFFGWEGCFGNSGCCEGNCTHVWNYQQTLAFLYPELERDMRLTEFNAETKEDGKMEFRAKHDFGGDNNYHPAADGQLGCVIRLYRDWKISGDTEFVRGVWENAKRALNFAFTYWDKNGDCVLDSQQHNTYDIEFYGPNSLINSMFFGALKAGAALAQAMGEPELAQRYQAAFEQGSARMDTLLWNGEYYAQCIEDVNAYKYQYGQGCLSDQLLGQELSHVAGLGYVLPREHVKSAVHSIFKYNFLTDFTNHCNLQRTYVLNDEQGLLLCTWPKGGRPALPFVYSDEVWTGIEYQVATHLIYEGFVEEAMTVVKALRDRHDGYKRNPWNEVECGNHYARSMASWGLLLALSGFHADLTEGRIDFAPVQAEGDYSCFFSCGKCWGRLVIREGVCSVEIEGGSAQGLDFYCDNRKIN